MTLSLANHHASLPIAHRLYLPEDWAKDRARRDKARVPETIAFQTKPEIAFGQISAAQAAGLPQGVVLMDAGYGNDTTLRTGITALGLSYVAGIGPNTSVWPLGTGLCHRSVAGVADDRPSCCDAPAASTARGKGSRSQPAGRRLASHHLARGQRGLARLALCKAAGATVGL